MKNIFITITTFNELFNEPIFLSNCILDSFKPCSDERQNGFKGLKLKRCTFLEPFLTSCERDSFCPKTLQKISF